MSSVSERLREERERLRLTQDVLSQIVGVQRRTLVNWERGESSPTAIQLEAFAKAGFDIGFVVSGVKTYSQNIVADSLASYGAPQAEKSFPVPDPDEDVYAAWAERIEGDMPKNYAPVRYYRYASLSAGHGAENHAHEPDALLFSKKFLKQVGAHPKDLMLVRVRGDSMSPTLQHGWTVMLDIRQRTIGSGIYALRMGNEELCKRLEYRPGGVVKVISDNRMYEEYEINMRDEGLDFAIMGRVIWVAGLV